MLKFNYFQFFTLIFLLLQFAAKKLDRRLVDLGAKPIIEKGLGDDQHPSGYVFNFSLLSCPFG